MGQGQVCYGSDWDVSSLSPLDGLRSILQTAAVPGDTWSARLATALRGYTAAAAEAMWLETVSGSIEVGKQADLCILGCDPFELGEEEFVQHGAVRVERTYRGGVCVFDHAQAAVAGEADPLCGFCSGSPHLEKEGSALAGCTCFGLGIVPPEVLAASSSRPDGAG